MKRAQVIQPTATDALYVALNLRQADRRELETASGVSAVEAVFRAWGWSEVSWIIEIDGKPAVIFGVAKDGVIWMVGTDAISTVRKEFFRLAQSIVEQLLQWYPRLHNQADCRNELHLRWLRLLGFTMGEFVGVNGKTFRQFHRERKEGHAPCANPQQSSQE
jgi:hypothetical protein